ncbi:two-component regulator propeller domain-containing protein [Mariniphaga sediminis]|uniref:two-component regulator propeller domain-containing protein n=1 Tax=Mariniphaga sediminis TaxID=1628158 RepID=UPI00356A649F
MNKDYDAILDIFEDNDGNIWLGTNGSGLIWSPDKESFYPVQYRRELIRQDFL